MTPEDEFGPPEPIPDWMARAREAAYRELPPMAEPKPATSALRAFDVASAKGIPVLGGLLTKGDAAADAADRSSTLRRRIIPPRYTTASSGCSDRGSSRRPRAQRWRGSSSPGRRLPCSGRARSRATAAAVTVASRYGADTLIPKNMRWQPSKACATSTARVRSPTTTSAPMARSASERSSSRRTSARTGKLR